MLEEDDPEILSYDPGRDDPEDALLKLDLEDSLRRFAQDRARLVGRLRTLAPADWERTARHDEYNAYSIFIMFRHLALHDFDHAYRIEALLLRKDWPSPDLDLSYSAHLDGLGREPPAHRHAAWQRTVELDPDRCNAFRRLGEFHRDDRE